MAIGMFLDDLPASLFIAVHVIQVLIGIWVLKMTMKDKPVKYWQAYILFVLGQLAFLAYFGNILTLKMAILLEQIFILVMVLWISMKAK